MKINFAKQFQRINASWLILCLSVTLSSFSFKANAQDDQGGYTVYVYTSDDLANDIENSKRGLISDIFKAGTSAVSGLVSGYIGSWIDLGVNTVGSIATAKTRHKEEWLQWVNAENSFETKLGTIEEIKDFYSESSYDSPLDPKGMCFDGIGCSRIINGDTAFYVSCHIDRSRIEHIVNHSKFYLVLDTLIICPTRSHLPNSNPKREFSFSERKDFTISMDIRLVSSWINSISQIQKDQELGCFSINIKVDPDNLVDGKLRYVRSSDNDRKYSVIGESFIVPRSYTGFRENGEYQDRWGTGEYKISITLNESCNVTDEFMNDWESDYKARKRQKPQDNTAKKVINYFKQEYDANRKTWIVTVLNAPAEILKNDIDDKIGLSSSSQSAVQSTQQSNPQASPQSAPQGF